MANTTVVPVGAGIEVSFDISGTASAREHLLVKNTNDTIVN